MGTIFRVFSRYMHFGMKILMSDMDLIVHFMHFFMFHFQLRCSTFRALCLSRETASFIEPVGQPPRISGH